MTPIFLNISGPNGPFLKTFACNVGHLIFSLFPFRVDVESKLEIFLQSPDSRGMGFFRETVKRARFIIKADTGPC